VWGVTVGQNRGRDRRSRLCAKERTMTKRSIGILALCAVLGAVTSVSTLAAEPPAMRPPAVPLVVHDPYFSIWSFGDKLAESWPRHWTGARHALCSMVRIDGKTYRIMGLEPKDVPAMEQTAVRVFPTRTTYVFRGGGVELVLDFSKRSQI
jgi:hypothetical protein